MSNDENDERDQKVLDWTVEKLVRSSKDSPKTQEVWRILFDGQVVTTNTGKYQWAKVGAAKSALQFHLQHYGYYPPIYLSTGKAVHARDFIRQTVQRLVASGRLQFVKIT